MREGAFLEYLPHHLIPYAGSNYVQEARFSVASDAVLIVWDAYAAGRIVRGERFAFERLRCPHEHLSGRRNAGGARQLRPRRRG